MNELAIIDLLPLLIIVAVAIVAARRKLGFPRGTQALKNLGLLHGPLRVVIVAALGLVADWAIYLFEAGADSPQPFYWVESIAASFVFAAIAVAVFSLLRHIAAIVLAGTLTVIYVFFIGSIYSAASVAVSGDWTSAVEYLIDSLFSLQYYASGLEFFAESPIYAVHGLLIIGAAFVLTKGWHPVASEPVQALGYGGRNMNSSSSETMRLLLGSAILNGSLFRRKVIERAEETHLARPPEPGINVEFLHRICKALERRETAYQALYLLLVIIAIFSFPAPETLPIAVLAVLIAIAVHLYRDASKRFRLATRLRNGSGRPEEVMAEALTLPLADSSPPAGTDDAVVIYRSFDPFDSFGTRIAHLSFSVDISRPKAGEAGGRHPSAFSTTELYAALQEQIALLQMPDVEIVDRLFVSGEDLPSTLNVNAYGPPRQNLSLDEIVALDADPNARARRYKCFVAKDWGGEMVISFFVSCLIRGRTLFVEVSGRLLPPLSSSYRQIERIPPQNFHTMTGWFIGTAAIAPFVAVLGAAMFVWKALEAVHKAFGSNERARKREIDNSPRYNFGANTALRREFASQQFVHYFQRMDMDYYLGTFNQTLFTIVVDFLDEHGIDTTSLKDQEIAILNSGVLIQGGNLTTQNLAVGEGARANILQKPNRNATAAGGQKAA